MTNPFAAITLRDYLTDGLAAALLISSLFMRFAFLPESSQSDTGFPTSAELIAVLLCALLSLLSLGMTYLWRAGVFGPGWGYRNMQLLRVGTNLPYLITFVVYLILAFVEGGYIGHGALLGLSGVMLAIQPRQSELGSRSEDVQRDQRWVSALGVVAGAGALVFVIQLIMFLMNSQYLLWTTILLQLVLGGACALFPILLAVAIGKGKEASRKLAVAAALAGMLVLLIILPQESRPGIGLSVSAPGFSVFFIVVFGALAAASPIQRQMLSVQSPRVWQQTLSNFLTVMVAVAVLLFIATFLFLVETDFGAEFFYFEESSRGTSMAALVMILIFSAVQAGGALLAISVLEKNLAQGLKLAMILAVASFVLLLIPMIMLADFGFTLLNPILYLAVFALPAGTLALVWGPRSLRERLGAVGNFSTGGRGFSFEGVKPAAATHPVVAAEPAVPADPELAKAQQDVANPQISQHRLQEIAQQYPALRGQVAQHRVVYAELVHWINQMQGTNYPVPTPQTINSTQTQAAAQQSKQEPADTSAETAADQVGNTRAEESQQEPEVEPGAAWVAEADPIEVSETDRAEHAGPGSPDAQQPETPAGNARVTEETETPATTPAVSDTQSEAGTEPEVDAEKDSTSEMSVTESDTNAQEEYTADAADEEVQQDQEALDEALAEPEPDFSAEEREAADPQTSPARLAELAGQDRQLHALIEANPGTYQALRDWIHAVTPQVYLDEDMVQQLREEAEDPGTSATRLQQLAGEHRFLHPLIARHPNAYEGLLTWLAEVNSPGVAEALEQR